VLSMEVHQAERDRIQKVFIQNDLNGDGVIDKSEFHSMLIRMGILLSAKDEMRLFDVMDRNKDGAIDLSEFGAHYATIVALDKRAQDKQVERLLKKTTFSVLEIQALYTTFKAYACSCTNDGVIDKQEFMQLMASADAPRNSFYYETLFQIFDADSSGGIDFNEFVCTLAMYQGKGCASSPCDVAEFFFTLCGGGKKGQGWITKSNMEKLLSATLASNSLKLSPAEVAEIVDLTFAKYSTSANGKMDFTTFQGRFPNDI